ncbi:MAG: type II toxin-antitoxin system VapC family toxin [Acidobacteriia bacterium]|nr:type II toxin-antitoxin system VapC family toxin [Terriglobia bacterium]
MIYADSSVIVKRYYQEPGSQRVTECWARSDRVFTSRVAYAEVHAAFARKRRDGGISAAQLRAAGDAFESEWSAYDQILFDRATSAHVRHLVLRHVLRGSDAIHLSAALWLQEQLREPVEFWVSDERLVTAAGKERLTVIDPAE